MPDYSLGKIYAIRSPNTDKIYIGSTTQPLYKRFWKHKNDYKNYEPGKKCTRSCIIFEAGNAFIELIENYPCNDRGELNRREGQLQREHKDCCCNRCIAGRTIKEYQTDNKNKIKVRKEMYRKINKDKIKVRYAKYYQKNKDKFALKTPCTHCGKIMRKRNRSTHIRKYCKKVTAQEQTN